MSKQTISDLKDILKEFQEKEYQEAFKERHKLAGSHAAIAMERRIASLEVAIDLLQHDDQKLVITWDRFFEAVEELLKSERAYIGRADTQMILAFELEIFRSILRRISKE